MVWERWKLTEQRTATEARQHKDPWVLELSLLPLFLPLRHIIKRDTTSVHALDTRGLI